MVRFEEPPPQPTQGTIGDNRRMRVTVLAGGLGGARFVDGVRHAYPHAEINVVANTADDIWLHGLRICPDLDTLMYYLGDGLDRDRGWGRSAETFVVSDELRAYGVKPDWFGLGDRDLATHLVRTQMINAGYPLSAVTSALASRWDPGVTLLPMTDDRVETHVIIDSDSEPSGQAAIHFQEWWVRHRATIPARGFVFVGIDSATAAPGVVEAINGADVVVLAPSNPVVSIGPILAVAQIRTALQTTPAPVIGVSGIIAGRPVRGMADACLRAIGVPTHASGVAAHYGSRPEGVLDGWLLDNQDADSVATISAQGIKVATADTLMVDEMAGAAVARAAVTMGLDARDGQG